MSNETVGEYISQLRKSRGYALREFAEKIDISPYYLCSIESGRRSNPNIDIIGRIYTALKLTQSEMEKLLDIYAKANGQVSADIIDFVMQNDDVRTSIREERDNSSEKYWRDFIDKITRENK